MILSAGGDNYWRIPRKPKGGYDWKQVAAQAAHGRDWPGFLRLLKDQPNACFQSNIGGTKNEEIFGGWLLVYEIVSYNKDKQFGLWEAAGLPEPTLVLDTGHHSLHVWFRLNTTYEPEDIEDARQRLAEAIDQVFRRHHLRSSGLQNPSTDSACRVPASQIQDWRTLQSCCRKRQHLSAGSADGVLSAASAEG